MSQAPPAQTVRSPRPSPPAHGGASTTGPPKRRTLRFWLGYPLYCIVCAACILAGVEVLLRAAFGLPSGRFEHILEAGRSRFLLPPSQRIEMSWGVLPYVVETNSLGLRGGEITPQKPNGVVRIAAIGDSITAGFFVDNRDTFPHRLQVFLTEQASQVEVINVAKGGGSIDDEYAILLRHALPLQPDVVLLTFCTNDIHGLRGKPPANLVPPKVIEEVPISPWRAAVYRATMHSALTEFLLDNYLRAKSEHYRHGEHQTGVQRYEIPGGNRYAENVRIFHARLEHCDGICLGDSFGDEVQQLIDNYTFALDHMNRCCQQHRAKLVFVYFPAYPQVYGENASLRIRDVLAEHCHQEGIPFCDLTPAFRRQRRQKVLHLAPLDFHPNPAGNQLIAETIGQSLLEWGLVLPNPSRRPARVPAVGTMSPSPSARTSP